MLLLAGAGCGDNGTALPSPGNEGARNASLAIAIGRSASRAAKDGDAMKNLTVLLANGTSIAARDISNPEAASRTVTFENLSRGPYTLYIVANAPEGLDLSTTAYAPGATLPAEFADRLLAALSGTASPSYDDTGGMPLTLVKEIMVVPGTNNVSAELERVVGRFSVSIHNHADNKTLCIREVRLSDFNASSGYLFNRDNTIPPGNTYRAFPAAAGVIAIPEHGSANAFDEYLYENKAPAYEMAIEGAIFEGTMATPVTYSVNKTIGSNETSISNTNNTYVIRSYSDDSYYLYMNGTTLSAKVPANDNELINDKNYHWQFSGTSSGTIKNVGTGRYITISDGTLSTGTSGSTFNFGISYGIYFRASAGRTRYFINRDGTNINTTSRSNNNPPNNNNNCRWYLCLYTETEAWQDGNGTLANPLKDFSTTIPINYLTPSGATVPLEYIYRNEHVHTTVNVFYNENYGIFNLEVIPWEKKTAEITFD